MHYSRPFWGCQEAAWPQNWMTMPGLSQLCCRPERLNCHTRIHSIRHLTGPRCFSTCSSSSQLWPIQTWCYISAFTPSMFLHQLILYRPRFQQTKFCAEDCLHTTALTRNSFRTTLVLHLHQPALTQSSFYTPTTTNQLLHQVVLTATSFGPTKCYTQIGTCSDLIWMIQLKMLRLVGTTTPWPIHETSQKSHQATVLRSSWESKSPGDLGDWHILTASAEYQLPKLENCGENCKFLWFQSCIQRHFLSWQQKSGKCACFWGQLNGVLLSKPHIPFIGKV